jgi:PTS system nitrogen regulatory IIA component
VKLTVKDAARMLHVSEREVYRWIRERSIPVHQIGDQHRFHRSELLEWATSRGIRITSEEFHSAPLNDEPMPSFAEALEAGGVHHGVKGSDRESVLRAVVDRMPIEEDDRELIYDFLVAREALGSTGIGDGIAIPHVRNPLVLHVARASITLCFLDKPVDFQSIDGQPVHTVFSLVSPTIRSHLYLLSRLSTALHDGRFKDAVLGRLSRERILEEARRVEGGFTQYPPPVREGPGR